MRYCPFQRTRVMGKSYIRHQGFPQTNGVKTLGASNQAPAEEKRSTWGLFKSSGQGQNLWPNGTPYGSGVVANLIRLIFMSPLEARKIIGALANGIDPETGEILPAQSAINNPQVVRALFVAVQALDKAVKRAERDDALPGNAGRSWSDTEDSELLKAFDAGAQVKAIAAKHGRTLGAITSRLVRLGRITDRAEIASGS